MSSDSAIHSRDEDDQFKPLMLSSEKKPDDGPLQRLMIKYNIKQLMKVWCPRVEFFVRLMLVATFLNDSFSTATHFSENIKMVSEQGFLIRLVPSSPVLATVIATVFLGIGLLAQSLGSICLVALIQPDYATKALIGWTIAQPILYAQLSNYEFVAESLSLVGGLLMIRAHLVSNCPVHKHTQLIGRMLLPATYLYQAGIFLFSAIKLDTTDSFGSYLSSLSMFAVNTAVLVGLVIGSTLVAAGLKSRIVALLLALLNICFVCYQHPFFRYIWREDGEWKYSVELYNKHVALPAGVISTDFDSGEIYDLHKYYFYLGLSTSGALLLLAQFGPGEMAVQKDEVLLPIMYKVED